MCCDMCMIMATYNTLSTPSDWKCKGSMSGLANSLAVAVIALGTTVLLTVPNQKYQFSEKLSTDCSCNPSDCSRTY